jgi:hypothetical protein
MKIALLVLLVVAAVIVGPILTIWALNTIFPSLSIPFTLWTWLAVAVLQFQLFYKSSSSSK